MVTLPGETSKVLGVSLDRRSVRDYLITAHKAVTDAGYLINGAKAPAGNDVRYVDASHKVEGIRCRLKELIQLLEKGV